MSIAWATIVIVVLLLPGFAFFWGFYVPNQITREVSPASPLAQLAGVVVISFFVHAFAYLIINTRLCTGAFLLMALPCVDFDELSALLRIDAFKLPGTSPQTFRSMLDQYIAWIILYFMATGAAAGLVGFGAGTLIERGRLRGFTRHRYLFLLEKGLRASEFVRAYVLSRTQNSNIMIVYDGLLKDFFAKADGTISYIVLHDPRASTIEIVPGGPTHSKQSIPLDIDAGVRGIQPFLVITSENIANVYYEPLNALRVESGDAEALETAIEELGQPGNETRGAG
jgi:hypothetical protein